MRHFLFIAIWVFSLSSAAFADDVKRYASIVVDADTLEIIHARQIDGQRFPASLTKVMTLYLVFDALDAGTLHLSDKMTVSKNAAATPPVSIGLRAGQKITVDEAIQALTVRSANDAAVVLAERLGGSEAAFAAQMTAKAKSLNMQRTVFKTPHGLPNPEQTTTARDMAKLASAVLTHHRRFYHYFSQKTFVWNGRTYRNTNNLLPNVEGVDGFKTGYTNDSGYNLIISAERSGRRIIAVVLGGASGRSRDQHMKDLIERGFQTVENSKALKWAPVRVTEPSPPKIEPQLASLTHAVRLRGRSDEPMSIISNAPSMRFAGPQYDSSWSIQVGAFTDPAAAERQLLRVSNMAAAELAPRPRQIAPLQYGTQTLYRARFTALTATQAQQACQALKISAAPCVVIAPGNG